MAKKNVDLKRILLFGIPLLLLAIGLKYFDDEAKILWFEKNETQSTAARFYLFSGEKERMLKANESGVMEIRWKPDLDRGNLTLKVSPSEGENRYTFGNTARTVELALSEGEKVHLTVVGEKAKGRFLIEWGKKEEESEVQVK